MEKIISPRGTKDILPSESALWQFIEAKAIETFSLAGFEEIRTPIFEHTQLFSRAVGESSDIVNKEMYTFADRSDRSITLRPEGTAGVARAFIEHNLDRGSRPQKLWYRGPMFRYERPQTGRYRQFYQIGMEAIGLEAPFIDLEVIKLAYNFLQELGIENLTLAINSIGSGASREAYRQQLLAFLSEYQDDICDDCKRRMQQNPLRVLDCKVPEDQAIYKNAPLIYDSFDEDSKQIFEQMKTGLEALGISYTIDSSLVRGLDYYSHCVFEFKTDDKGLGQQSTVLAGGRYDNLISELGGGTSPAVGWALGMERIAYLLEAKKFPETKRVYIISDSAIEASKLAHRLRSDAKVLVEYDFEEAKVAKQMNKALKRNASHGIFYLEDERKSGGYLVKDFQAKTELKVNSYAELLSFFT
ncbi:MAG: histidine--tRNA ligase [bacterium]